MRDAFLLLLSERGIVRAETPPNGDFRDEIGRVNGPFSVVSSVKALRG